jgi:hypothetical protein
MVTDQYLGCPLADLGEVGSGELLRLRGQVGEVAVLIHGGLAQHRLRCDGVRWRRC